MILSSPIVVTPPSFTRANGEVRSFSPITFNELDIVITDDVKRKRVSVSFSRIPRPLLLWEKMAYDAVGDYTQAQVESRILELLGDKPSLVLENLFKR